jgi:hypothetical protein
MDRRFKPTKEWNTPAGIAREAWVYDASSPIEANNAKYSIPKMEGAPRIRAISSLSSISLYRRINNSIHFLLYRGMSINEASLNITNNFTFYPLNTLLSFSPIPKVAHRQAYYEEPKGIVIAAWIPISSLYSSLKQYSSPIPRIRKLLKQEDEWLVLHSSPIEVYTIIPAISPRKLTS